MFRIVLRCICVLVLAAILLPSSSAHAQADAPTPEPEVELETDVDGADPRVATTDAADPTRLDVERLPPEAIRVTRDMYARGGFIEAHFGVRWFAGAAGALGSVSKPGPMLHIGGGYQLTRWFMVQLAFEASLHSTDAPRPPATEIFEVYDIILELRLQANISARAALFLGAEIGLSWTNGDVLRTYGLRDADRVGLAAGGQVGFDWHMRNQHSSMGILGGARVYPNLTGTQGGVALGLHASAYLRYVFS